MLALFMIALGILFVDAIFIRGGSKYRNSKEEE